MPPNQRIGGIINIQVNGVLLDAKGAFEYDLGGVTRETVAGVDGIHGYTEKPKAAFIDGTITDRGNLDLKALANGKNQTVTLKLANRKTVVLRNGWYVGDATGNTEQSEIKVRWEGASAQEFTT